MLEHFANAHVLARVKIVRKTYEGTSLPRYRLQNNQQETTHTEWAPQRLHAKPLLSIFLKDGDDIVHRLSV